MKEHQKELIIVPSNTGSSSSNRINKILYNNYEIGTLLLQNNPIFPSSIGAPFYIQYIYTLIFDKKESECDIEDPSLNIALDSIQTNGFYQLINGTQVVLGNLNLPVGTYKNIGVTPEGIRYNLELITNKEESKIILSKIC